MTDADVIREALMGVAPNDPTMWEEKALAALDRLVAERDEAIKEHGHYIQKAMRATVRAEAAEAERDRLSAVLAAARLVDEASAEIPVDRDKVWRLCEEMHSHIRDYDRALAATETTP